MFDSLFDNLSFGMPTNLYRFYLEISVFLRFPELIGVKWGNPSLPKLGDLVIFTFDAPFSPQEKNNKVLHGTYHSFAVSIKT